MTDRDAYDSFAELACHAREGVDYGRVVSDRGSDIVIAAPHGGGIEPGTSELAKAVAGNRFSLYCFEGLRRTGNRRLHVRSTRFDDAACLRLVERSRVVITIHGSEGTDGTVHIGGRHHRLGARMTRSLRAARFCAREAQGHHPGRSVGNLCNRGQSGRGLQLELTTGLRRVMFSGLKRRDRQTTTHVFDTFVGVVMSVLLA